MNTDVTNKMLSSNIVVLMITALIDTCYAEVGKYDSYSTGIYLYLHPLDAAKEYWRNQYDFSLWDEQKTSGFWDSQENHALIFTDKVFDFHENDKVVFDSIRLWNVHDFHDRVDLGVDMILQGPLWRFFSGGENGVKEYECTGKAIICDWQELHLANPNGNYTIVHSQI